MKSKDSVTKAKGEWLGSWLRHHFGIRSASAEGDGRVVRSLWASHINLRKLNIHERELIITTIDKDAQIVMLLKTKVCTKSYISIFTTLLDLHSNKDE